MHAQQLKLASPPRREMGPSLPLFGRLEGQLPAASRLRALPRSAETLLPQNRRYMGNKHKLLGFIETVVAQECGQVQSVCDIFAGTGVVGHRLNRPGTQIIANDLLRANHVCLQAFLGTSADLHSSVAEKVAYLNGLPATEDNYFSEHFGGTYFTVANARKIGAVRAAIDSIAESDAEQSILLCSLIYATDKVANTVGHYDAFRRTLDALQPLRLRVPSIDHGSNAGNVIRNQDANALVREVSSDLLYIDPPYNSRQYSDAYHLLENLAEWRQPEVSGICGKMDRSHIKSEYCLRGAANAFADLVEHADCKHILLSYNNTGDSKDGRSNARISDAEIVRILSSKGTVKTFETKYRAFTTGKSGTGGNVERLFHCRVR